MKIYFGALAVVLAMTAVGCGSGGDTTEVVLTKAQFIKRGDAICRAHQAERTKEINAWLRNPSNRTKKIADYTPEERGEVYLTVALPPVREAWGELDELAESVSDEKAEKVVDALGSSVEAIEEEPARGLVPSSYKSSNEVAREYGFKDCGLF